MHKPSALRAQRMSAAEIRRLRGQLRHGSCWPIDRVVEWSRSAGRGPLMSQDEFLFAAQLDGCMRWGLCDTGAANTLPAEVSHAG
jgi:hypothetical protein